MLIFPITNLFIEGPDCAGKTTLINEIHKKSSYRWHIQDRSQISRRAFAKMYDRRVRNIDDDFHLEISNLNNRFIFLLPDFDEIKKRFKNRGDEIHKTVESMRSVYAEFCNAHSEVLGFPNVISCYSNDNGDLADKVITSFDLSERAMLKEVSDQVLSFVRFSGGESYPLQFALYDDGEFEEATRQSMNYEPEREYYEKIYNGLHSKISRELDGENEYGRRETSSSRRFVYTDDSCISFIQFAIRKKLMDFHVVIRSSDTKSTFEHDLKFLYYLASTCYDLFSDECDRIRLRFNLNSAHIAE
tara:strand:- start:5 stop:910 length:906 start_codon:yes stop_codon:yes gene_type:complete